MKELHPGGGVSERQVKRIALLLGRERRSGLLLALRLRLAVLALIGVYLLGYGLDWSQGFNFAALFTLGLLPWLRLRIVDTALDGRWAELFFPVIDVTLVVALTVFQPVVFHDAAVVDVEANRPFTWLLLLIAVNYLTARPSEAVWTGIAAAAAWLLGFLFIANRPDAVLHWSFEAIPGAVNSEVWLREAAVIFVVSLLLALGAWRTRLLTRRAVQAERGRANLARYFSPGMVDHLQHNDQPLGQPRHQHAAILFVDIVGFTRIAQHLPPAEVIQMLRAFHARVAETVFANGGTLDKFIGDAAMITFGTPVPGRRDASCAVETAIALAARIDEWNEERAAANKPRAPIGIGGHWGPVVMGDIGDERRLEFAVLGDTVNVASRLERISRDLGAQIVLSDALVRAALEEGLDAALLDDLQPVAAPQPVRGRDAAVAVWIGGSASDFDRAPLEDVNAKVG